MASVNDLPCEILLKIFNYLPGNSLVLHASLVCRNWHWLIMSEVRSGRIRVESICDGRLLVKGEDHFLDSNIAQSVTSLRLVSFDCREELQRVLVEATVKCSRLRKLFLAKCDCSTINLTSLDQRLTALSVKDSKTSPWLWEEISKLHGLTELTIPDLPTAFLPFVLLNKTSVTRLEVGEIPNQLIYMVCSAFPSTLRSLAFHGGQTTYSGVISLYRCVQSLTELKIRDPKYLTKYSLKMLSGLRGLKTLELYWLGRMLINNPWSFDFSLDRREQRVDNLFVNNGLLTDLQRLDLSAFYQTVDNKLVQLLCQTHLSSNSDTARHLTHVSLAHCYQVSDTGVQWLVGSRHSGQLVRLDLSGTDLTGNCFVKSLPRLECLVLDCCSLLMPSGMSSIAVSCPALRSFSLAKCKQIGDQDMQGILKNLKLLERLDVSYTNVGGKCFEKQQTNLQRLCMNSCHRAKDDCLRMMLAACPYLRYLDVSATKVTGTAFLGVTAPNLVTLYSDFCLNLCPCNLLETLSTSCPRLLQFYGYGNHQAKIDPCFAQTLKSIHSNLKFILVSSEAETEGELREYARIRGLHLTNWLSTKRHMIKSMPGLLSQIWLTSVE